MAKKSWSLPHLCHCGGAIAQSAVNPWKLGNIASRVMVVSIKQCLLEGWHLPESTLTPPNKCVNVMMEFSGEITISVLCVGLSDF